MNLGLAPGEAGEGKNRGRRPWDAERAAGAENPEAGKKSPNPFCIDLGPIKGRQRSQAGRNHSGPRVFHEIRARLVEVAPKERIA